MQLITRNGIEYRCITTALGAINACELLPIIGIDEDSLVNDAVVEVRNLYHVPVVGISWRQPPAEVLVKIYLNDRGDLVIEGAEQGFGNLYWPRSHQGTGTLVYDTGNFLGITQEALPVFHQLWENAEYAEGLIGTLNWFVDETKRGLFYWNGPARKSIKITDNISKNGRFDLSNRLIRIL